MNDRELSTADGRRIIIGEPNQTETREMWESTHREIVLTERHRCIGLVLAEYGVQKAGGREQIAKILDDLATLLEHPDDEIGSPDKDA